MQFPHIDPVFLSIGPLQFRWYGLMYVLAFVATYLIIRGEVRRRSLPLTGDDVSDLVFQGALGIELRREPQFVDGDPLVFLVGNRPFPGPHGDNGNSGSG